MPLSALIYDPPVGRSPIPQFESLNAAMPTVGLDVLELHWTALGDSVEVSPSEEWTWVAGFGPTSAGVARRSPNGGWEYGLSFNEDRYLGTQTSGAFGADVRLRNDLDLTYLEA